MKYALMTKHWHVRQQGAGGGGGGGGIARSYRATYHIMRARGFYLELLGFPSSPTRASYKQDTLQTRGLARRA